VILSDQELRSVQAERSVVSPWNPAHLQPASVDLTLSRDIVVMGIPDSVIVVGNPGEYPQQFDTATYALAPGQFVLASTVETVAIPTHLVGQINGRSSWARKGLIVHTTAGFIDPGFTGQITLELKNVGHTVIDLHAGDRICQLVLMLMTSPALRPYGSDGLGSHYQGQRGTTPSVLP
jgi:dCTP deaminase